MRPHQRDFAGNGQEGRAVKTVSVGVQVSINLSPKESRAVKRLPVGLGTSMYWVMFSVTHCHGSGPRDDVGSALGICVMTISGATALIHAQRLVTARKRGIFMAVVIQIHQKRRPKEKRLRSENNASKTCNTQKSFESDPQCQGDGKSPDQIQTKLSRSEPCPVQIKCCSQIQIE